MSEGPIVTCPLSRGALLAYARALGADGGEALESVGRHLAECGHCMTEFGELLAKVHPTELDEMQAHLREATASALLEALDDSVAGVRLAALKELGRLDVSTSSDVTLVTLVSRLADADDDARVQGAAREQLRTAIARLRASRHYVRVLRDALAALPDRTALPWGLLQAGSLLPTAGGASTTQIVLRGEVFDNACRVELAEADARWRVSIEIKDRSTGALVSDLTEVLFVDPGARRESVHIVGPPLSVDGGVVFEITGADAARIVEVNRVEGKILVFTDGRL